MQGNKRKNKHNAKVTYCDGIRFASKLEATRYRELKRLEADGQISELRLQVRFNLIPPKKPLRGVSYVADFVYRDVHGDFIVEDAKGVRTKDYIIKKKLMWYMHGILIHEV